MDGNSKELMAVAVQAATTAANVAALTKTIEAMSEKLDGLHDDFSAKMAERRGMEKLVRGAYAFLGGVGGTGTLILVSKLTGVPLPR